MERELIAWLEQHSRVYPGTELALGDDASLHPLPAGNGYLAVTTDLLVEGTHFDLAAAAPRRVGHKSLAVNLSDLAAMAARPQAFWVALVLPEQLTVADAEPIYSQLYRGMLELADRFQLSLAGGDTNSGGDRWVISITALGITSARPWLRSAAQPGDRLLVTGSLGGSILGHHLDFVPRIDEALELNENYPIQAALDLSDGLSLDLWRMLQASGLGAELDLERIPISAAARQLAKTSGKSPLEHALNDGEDFELLIAAAPEVAAALQARHWPTMTLTEIGTLRAGTGMFGTVGGTRTELQPQGYWHGAG